MKDSTITPAFNSCAPKQVVNVKRRNARRKSSGYKRRKNKKDKTEPNGITLDGVPYIRFDPQARGSAPALHLDIEAYIHQFKDFVLTEEEKIEILKSLWEVMCRFVEFGFGLDGYSLACEQNSKRTTSYCKDMVDLDHPEDNP